MSPYKQVNGKKTRLCKYSCDTMIRRGWFQICFYWRKWWGNSHI